jgi:hypothetical protein
MAASLTFKPVDPAKIPKRGGRLRSSKYDPLIERFLQSSVKAAEVELNGSKAPTVATSCKKAAKGKGVLVLQRAGRVFLVKEAKGR